MRHIIFLDPLEKLVIKKDSTLLLALTLKEEGHEVYLLFEDDFYWTNHKIPELKVNDFQGSYDKNSFYIESFSLASPKTIVPDSNDIIHMRLDPPFDTKYLQFLWMLKLFTLVGCKVINSVSGILLNNEKLHAYKDKQSISSFVGTSIEQFGKFIEDMKGAGLEYVVFKPLGLYQGIGVEKISIAAPDLFEIFQKKKKAFHGPMVVQPFINKVSCGEIRSLFYKCEELGSILKVPPEGDFLANIARGAKYSKYGLSKKQKSICIRICKELEGHDVDFIAFDILDEYVSEVNITCPGLLVEVSNACSKNLASDIVEMIK